VTYEQLSQTPPTLPDDDAERFALVAERLYTAVVGDILDAVGRTHQFLPPQIVPLRPEMVVVGRAMPVLVAEVYGPQVRPFGLLTEALDQLQPGEVYVAHGGGAPCAAWGEILTATARMRGAAGAVLHGYHRDTPKVLAQDWPVFSHGPFGQDASVRSSVIGYRTGIEIAGVRVEPGDLVVGDVDGVVIVPRAVEDEVLGRALEKASAENTVLDAILRGRSSSDAFAQYGVL
jgi:4-hydroxy-4-methyl-2-oxoglutarate aldolase